MVAREPLDERAGHVDLAVHEHVLPRHEDLVEVDQHLLPAVDDVALVDRGRLHGPQVRGLPPVDVGDARGVDRDRGHDRVVRLVAAQRHRRHEHDPVAVPATGHVCLGATQVQPVLGAAGDVDVQVLVGLLGRSLAPVALDVGHPTGEHEVAALELGQEGDEPVVVVRAVLLVEVVGDRVQGGHGVQSDAPLEARPGALAEFTLHAVLGPQVLR